ncbi:MULTISPECIES: hypothetical protein [unclassified Deinococcus]|uniref:hypothetical protein n=1 Tax=unclassified Deinococcus TaxID=2623546 RepID=UPI000B0FFE3D|nr:hypothetical protein [Deinococcus sp. UR1]
MTHLPQRSTSTPKKTYVRPVLHDAGSWNTATLQASVPVIPIGPGSIRLPDRRNTW